MVKSKVPIPKAAYKRVPLDKVDIDPVQNMRRHYNPASLQQLMYSIARVGLLTPVVLEKEGSRYKVRAGFRRTFAVKELHRKFNGRFSELESKVHSKLTKEQRIAMMVAENICKEKIPQIELAIKFWELYKINTAKITGKKKALLDKAPSYWELSDEVTEAYSLARFAEETGKSKDDMRRKFLVQKLHDLIKKDVREEKISCANAAEFATLSPKDQVRVARELKAASNGKYPKKKELMQAIRETSTETYLETIFEPPKEEKRVPKIDEKVRKRKITKIAGQIKTSTKLIKLFTELATSDRKLLSAKTALLVKGRFSARDAIREYKQGNRRLFKAFEKTRGYKQQRELERLRRSDLEERIEELAKKTRIKKAVVKAKEKLHYLNRKDIIPDKDNARKTFDKASLEELADSFKTVGQLEPIIVRPKRIRGKKKYIIVDGERRYRAAGIAGFKRIEALVREMSDEEAALCQIEADVHQRVSQHDTAESLATLYLLLKEKNGEEYTVAQFCKEHKGVKEKKLLEALRYNKLDDKTKSLCATELITYQTAIKLGAIEDKKDRYEAALTCILYETKPAEITASIAQDEAGKGLFSKRRYNKKRELREAKQRDLTKVLSENLDASAFFPKQGEFTLENLADNKQIAAPLFDFYRAYEKLVKVAKAA